MAIKTLYQGSVRIEAENITTDHPRLLIDGKPVHDLSHVILALGRYQQTLAERARNRRH